MTDFEIPVRHVISAFNVALVHMHMKPLQTNSEVLTPETDWALWTLTAERHQPPIIVFDNQRTFRESRLEYCLEPVRDEKTITLIEANLPEPITKKVTDIWLKWPNTEVAYFRPVPRLRSTEILRSIDWMDFVENHVVAFTHDDEQEKDSRLILVHKCTSLKGLNPYLNPNSIQCTTGGTGKSEFYFHMGRNFGKVTRNTFLGFAKSPTEIYPGLIDGTELPIGIDQIESQSAPQIMAYMFNALERGEDQVASGSVIFKVKTKSVFNLLANPTSQGDKIEPSKGFRYMLYHLTVNAAIGRRFGIICYGTDFKKIRHKPSPAEIEQWERNILLFRAVEEYCEPQLQRITENPKVREWLNKQIPDYETQIQLQSDTIEDENVRTFLTEHATGAQVRVRGAALYGALADSLDKIALGEFTIDDVLDHAQDLLSEIVTLNISSVGNIAQNWKIESANQAKMVFRNLPTYLKEILSAIELWRRKYPDVTDISLNQIPYEPADATYTHLSKCSNKLSKRTGKGKTRTLDEIREYYQVDLIEKPNDGWAVHYLKSDPNHAIEPLGKLTDISPLSPISPFHQSFGETSDGPASGAGVRNGGETVKTGKLVNADDSETVKTGKSAGGSAA